MSSIIPEDIVIYEFKSRQRLHFFLFDRFFLLNTEILKRNVEIKYNMVISQRNNPRFEMRSEDVKIKQVQKPKGEYSTEIRRHIEIVTDANGETSLKPKKMY